MWKKWVKNYLFKCFIQSGKLHGMILNMWILNIHRYLFYQKMPFGTSHFPNLRSCQLNFLLCTYFFRLKEVKLCLCPRLLDSMLPHSKLPSFQNLLLHSSNLWWNKVSVYRSFPSYPPLWRFERCKKSFFSIATKLLHDLSTKLQEKEDSYHCKEIRGKVNSS